MKSFNSIKRKTVRISMADLVKVEPLDAGKPLPSLITPQAENMRNFGGGFGLDWQTVFQDVFSLVVSLRL